MSFFSSLGSIRPATLLSLFSFILFSFSSALLAADWPQWGGPSRDFVSQGEPLAENWGGNDPENQGPEKLWERSLGDGYAGIAAVGDRLYTMYRENNDEVVIVLDAGTGETVWEHRYDATPTSKMKLSYGPGPHVTPTVDRGLVFTAGVMGVFHALDAQDGSVVWKRDLVEDLGGDLLVRGYAVSPLIDGDNVLLKLGGENAVIALHRKTGEVVWKTEAAAENSQSSPILVNVKGERQLIAFMAGEVIAVSPDDGRLLWRHKHRSGAVYNIMTPLYLEESQHLFLSSAYGGGSRLLKILPSQDGAGQAPVELWESNRLNVHFTNAVRIGDLYVGSNGATGSTILSALDAETGALVWKSRDVERSSFVQRGDRFLALDHEGRLALLGLSRDGVQKFAEYQLFEDRSFTPPTLVGKTAYARDREKILALRLP